MYTLAGIALLALFTLLAVKTLVIRRERKESSFIARRIGLNERGSADIATMILLAVAALIAWGIFSIAGLI